MNGANIQRIFTFSLHYTPLRRGITGDNHITKCIAKKMKNYFTGNGTDLPSEKEIIAAFTVNGVGMVVGYVLYNKNCG